MNVATALFGALTLDFPKQNRSFGRGSALVFSDVLLILGVGLGLLLILAAGVYLWSKSGRKRRRHISSGEKVFRDPNSREDNTTGGADDEIPAADHSDSHEDEDDEHDDDDHHGRRRYRYRVRRRSHRSRNPTLSETGGLPPVKAQEPSKPA